ncbi:FRG domain-containing protein [Methylococcus sp. EFPC2]|uniref:FRG domain-containing protein n=1 Tax=Methylococcus sp. EFPC2 TaxID=2812648 RepID=UPI0019688153|nr:FRG domain-containing protein [Methylococcus sp. EFPC2]QSA96923.1 FRG domain-containing protein [Methylococcus sp. EFPC2]
MIEEIFIESPNDLMFKLNDLPNHFIYRGHSNAGWKLESALERVIGDKWSSENARKFEDYSYRSFRSKYHIYAKSEHVPTSKLSWLSVMQHYGIPTRLLDFTESPYVALYFALEAYNPLSKEDFSVYAIDYTAIMEASIEFIRNRDSKFSETRASIGDKKDHIFDEVVDRFAYDILWITEPLEQNARMDRQFGTFLISGNRGKTIESIVSSGIYEKCRMYKFVVSHAFYENIYALLRKAGINAKVIYGDLTGLAKAIKMELQVYAI